MKLSGRSAFRHLSLVAAACGLAAAAQCPVDKCKAGSSFLQTGSDPVFAIEGETPCKEVSHYDVNFLPGHFVCTRCDAASCEGCGVLCDLSSCVGEFYTQECWCEKASGGEGSVAFCNEKCGGGLCDGSSQACRPREEACQPWWWCGSSPPTSLVQESHRSSRLLLASGSGERRARTLQLSQELQMRRAAAATATRRLRSARAQLATGSNASLTLPPEAQGLHFKRGRFDCSSGALPPKTRDPQTLLWVERGYLVLDARSCEGSAFVHKCYCWDNVLRLRGQDPRTSEMKCDKDCGWGACEGRTCSRKPPPPLSSLAHRHVEAGVSRVDSAMNVVMEALE